MFVWKFLFRWLDNIVFIYHLNENKVKNITWNYYLGYGLDKYKYGTYYAKIFKTSGTNHVAFDGHLDHIENIKIVVTSEIKPPKRKHVILLDNGLPISVDLAVLDNYKINMKHYENYSVKNLGKILKLLGLDCSHVTIIQHVPFSKKTIDVHETDIDIIYQ